MNIYQVSKCDNTNSMYWMCAPPQITGWLKPNPQWDRIRRWDLWEVLRTWRQSLHKWDLWSYKTAPHSFHPWGHPTLKYLGDEQKGPGENSPLNNHSFSYSKNWLELTSFFVFVLSKKLFFIKFVRLVSKII